MKKGIATFWFFAATPEVLKIANKPVYEFADKNTYGPALVGVNAPATDAGTKYNATLAKLALESFVQIITGSKPVDYFEEFVQQGKANGLEEVEKQITEAWKAAGGK